MRRAIELLRHCASESEGLATISRGEASAEALGIALELRNAAAALEAMGEHDVQAAESLTDEAREIVARVLPVLRQGLRVRVPDGRMGTVLSEEAGTGGLWRVELDGREGYMSVRPEDCETGVADTTSTRGGKP